MKLTINQIKQVIVNGTLESEVGNSYFDMVVNGTRLVDYVFNDLESENGYFFQDNESQLYYYDKSSGLIYYSEAFEMGESQVKHDDINEFGDAETRKMFMN